MRTHISLINRAKESKGSVKTATLVDRLRRNVIQQTKACIAVFVGSCNYSDTFTAAAKLAQEVGLRNFTAQI